MKNHFHIKIKAIAIIAVLLLCASSAWAEEIKKHVVERGETLSSIATKYGVSQEEIIKLNPEAKQFIYVGMELVIPVTPAETSNKEQKPSTVKQVEVKQSNVNQTATSSTDFYNDGSEWEDFRKWTFVGRIAYGILPKPEGEGVSGTNHSLSFSLGAEYNINKSLYVGARIGYSSVNINNLKHMGGAEWQNTETSNHMITLPIEVGYKFHLVEEKVMLTPYAGLDFNFAVKSTSEQGIGSDKDKKSIDPSDRFGANGHIGVRVGLWEFDLGCTYVFSFDDSYGEDDGFPEISLGFTF